MPEPHPTSTLSEAMTWLQEQARAQGAACPCCKRFTKIYRRTITRAMFKDLVEFYRHRHRKGDFVDCKKVLPAARGGDYGKLKFWGLLEHKSNLDPATKDSGFWRITFAGKEFLKGRRTMPKFALVFDNECIGLEGPQVGPVDCLKAPFDFSELMDEELEPLQPGEESQLDLLESANV